MKFPKCKRYYIIIKNCTECPRTIYNQCLESNWGRDDHNFPGDCLLQTAGAEEEQAVDWTSKGGQ